MSCWVVPAIAAELWNVSVEHVQREMRAGRVPSKTESGFTFVDVAPESPKLQRPESLRPITYIAVTGNELAALGDADEQTPDFGDWERAREEAALRRRRPMAA